MLFLIRYDPAAGRIVSMKTFKHDERSRADDVRIELEVRLNQEQTEHEIVLMEAASEQALRRTHRRFFEPFSDLVDSR